MTAAQAWGDFRGQRTAPVHPARPPESADQAPCPCPACRCDRSEQPATAPHRSDPADGVGCRWLILAAEMAGVVNDGWRSSPQRARTGWEWPPRIATCTLGPEARSVRAARDFTCLTLRRWGTGYSSQDIVIVVSELVTNALRHALPGAGANGPPGRVRLGLLQSGPWLLCAVSDPSAAAPVQRPCGSLAETGRGLQMICSLSDQWGYTTPGDSGKIVWAAFTAVRPRIHVQ